MAVREIILDTETTGLSPNAGDRIVEIGCVEMLNHIPTGQVFHVYLNPERDMPEAAFKVHGLAAEFLSDKPLFAAVAADFTAFIGDARLVAHNAAFDIAFLNAELARVGQPPIATERVVDTLALARRKFPFAQNSLDALCQRFGIDNARRTKHGALLDSEILADVYIELLGGRQADLGLASAESNRTGLTSIGAGPQARPGALPARLTAVDLAAHEGFVATLTDNPVWRDYLPAAGTDGAAPR